MEVGLFFMPKKRRDPGIDGRGKDLSRKTQINTSGGGSRARKNHIGMYRM